MATYSAIVVDVFLLRTEPGVLWPRSHRFAPISSMS